LKTIESPASRGSIQTATDDNEIVIRFSSFRIHYRNNQIFLPSSADAAKKPNGPTVDIIRSAPDSNIAFPCVTNVNNSYGKPFLYK
jgi:hypothetical protein